MLTDPTTTEAAPAIERERLHGSSSLPLTLLRPNPWNRKADPKKLAELTATVKLHGVMQPIVARPIDGARAGQPLYEIVAGERRWRASTDAGLAEIPVIIKQLTDLQVIELMLVENLEREALHELDEAEGYDRLLRRADGLQGFASIEELCKRLDKSRSYVFQRLKLLQLCDQAKEAFRAGKIDFGHARAIAPIADLKRQAEAVKEIVQGFGGNRMTVVDAQEHVRRKYMLDLSRAVFKIGDADLVPAAGACTQCPKRSGANPELFDGGAAKRGDLCTDPTCFQAKEEAHRQRLKDQAEAAGRQVITGKAAKAVKPQQYTDKLKGYLALDKTHYEIGDKPLRQLLGKKLPEVKLLEDPHTKALVEVVEEKAALELLKERGVLKQARLPSGNAQQRDLERKAKAENTYRAAVAAEVVRLAGEQAGATMEYRQALLVELAALVWNRLDHDATTRVRKLLAWGDNIDPRGSAEQRVRGLTDGELARFFTAAVLTREMHVSTYNLKGNKPERMLALCGLLGVDAAAMRDELRREQLQRVPAKKATKAKPEQTPETALAAALKDAKPAKQKRPTVPAAKYVDPATGSTWSGRGLQPAWLKAALADGKELADFEVKPATPRATLSAAAADMASKLQAGAQ